VWGRIQGSIIERNINTGGRFIALSSGIRETTYLEDNWDGDDPRFVDKDNMNFNLRPGSPAYGLTGCEPVVMQEIGVYKDPLRASWPINRTQADIGKYYNPDWKRIEEISKTVMVPMKRVSAPLHYTIGIKKNPITIDGKLEKEEWGSLETKDAMVIEQHWDGKPKKAPKSYAWLLYDNSYLYIAVKHEADPWTEDMPVSVKGHMPVVEVSFESQQGPHSQGWWMVDMTTGPIYTIWGHFDGKVEVMNTFGMPYNKVKSLEQKQEYKVFVQDKENQSWTAEWKIPFSEVGLNPSEVDKLCFNIGVWKREGWFAWVATGSSIWRVENAGFISFAR